jgi:hypothetical protein
LVVTRKKQQHVGQLSLISSRMSNQHTSNLTLAIYQDL